MRVVIPPWPQFVAGSWRLSEPLCERRLDTIQGADQPWIMHKCDETSSMQFHFRVEISRCDDSVSTTIPPLNNRKNRGFLHGGNRGKCSHRCKSFLAENVEPSQSDQSDQLNNINIWWDHLQRQWLPDIDPTNYLKSVLCMNQAPPATGPQRHAVDCWARVRPCISIIRWAASRFRMCKIESCFCTGSYPPHS
jgi:hypothetical protein